MRRDLKGRRVLLTGASSGIGLCIARLLAADGARLALAARSEDKLRALAEELQAKGADAFAIRADLTNDDERRRLVDEAAAHLGGLDVLLNNAGIGSWAHFADGTEDILRRIMEVNFFAPTELIRLAIPHLTQGEQPAVMSVASMCGRKGMPAWSEYSASKYALCGFIEAMRGELARFDIDVLAVLPGLTKSELAQHLLKSEGRYPIDYSKAMPPERVAETVVWALKKNKTETVVGKDARWLLRFNRLFPRLTDWLIARRVKKLYA
ncbi:MAG: SDR family oxidoreductase [Gemmataceae bacterium]|mgnify:CR=1 FL=1